MDYEPFTRGCAKERVGFLALNSAPPKRWEHTYREPQITLKTLRWVAMVLACAGPIAQAAIPQSERDTLVAFFYSTNGPNWNDRTGWLGTQGTECSWRGVTCDGAETTVLKFEIFDPLLCGPFADISGLTNLQVFRAGATSCAGLTGSIPPLNGLKALQWFDVTLNGLSGPIPDLSGLTNLQVFDAGQMALTGSIPALSTLTSLHEFDVDSNQISGPIPPLAGLQNLWTFEVSFNHLSGTIPPLTGLDQLGTFDVFSNQLTGQIPSLGGLGMLGLFEVGQNHLSGPLPAPPATLVNGGYAILCPNPLDLAPGPYDGDWNMASWSSHWWWDCDPIFANAFELF